jgi:hypothetical protein
VDLAALMRRVFDLDVLGNIALTAPDASRRRARERFTLWHGSPAGTRHASIDVRYERPFPLRYFSVATGHELLWSTIGTVDAHLDRPLRGDDSRLELHATCHQRRLAVRLDAVLQGVRPR